MNIELKEFGSVIVALLGVGALLKHAFPKFPNEKIPLVTALLGTLAYVALTKGWANPVQWIEGFVAAITATGVHSGLKNTFVNAPAGTVPVILLVGLFGLTGCGTTAQRPPSATEQKYFDVVTNVVPIVVTVTNVPAPVVDEATGTVTLPAPVVERVTNLVEQFDFTPNANAQALASTSAAVTSIWNPVAGGAVGATIMGLFGLWGLFRSKKRETQNELTQMELAQIIETGRQLMLSLPDGAKYEQAYKDWMVKHQAKTDVIAQVAAIVAAGVDNEKARGAAQTIVNLIQAQPK